MAGRLIELQGGELQARPRPACACAVVAAGGELTDMTTSYEPRLLVVDDDPLIREELESLFATQPYHVECVASVDRRHAEPVASASSRSPWSTCASAAATASR